MSLDLSIRQKLIKVFASSAVCGLSVSFILGELVDHRARQISVWDTDAKFIPVSYLPIQPVLFSLAVFSGERFVASLSEANTISPSPTAPEVQPVFQDTLKTILSSAVDTVPTRSMPDPEPQVDAREVKKILGALHATTSKLSDPGPLSKDLAVKLERTQQKDISPPKENSAEISRTAMEKIESDWVIKGRILTGYVRPGAGHFEIGFYSKVDQDGVPIGFPLVQKILSSGESDFSLIVPSTIDRGFLYGEFVSGKTGKRVWVAPPVNPWERNSNRFAELVMRQEDSVSSVASSSSASVKIKGTVTTLFSKGEGQIPQEDVVIKVRGRKDSARTDKRGSFMMEVPRWRGSIFLEVLKAGYHPVLVSVPSNDGDQTVSIELASRDAIEQIARRLGTRQISSKGVFLGKAMGADGNPLKGMTVQTSLKSEGPFYFGEDGFPSLSNKATTADGRFLFLNLEQGTGFVETALNGESLAPFVFTTVEGGELVLKNLTPVSGLVKGRIFNPVSSRDKLAPLSGARIRVEGAFDWSNTDSYGAFMIGPMKWIRGERMSLELTAEKYNNHRYLFDPDKKVDSLNLYAFPAIYLGRLAKTMDVELDPYAGIVVGKVSQMRVRIDALADHSIINSAKDFYFDGKGRIHGSHTMTDPRFGNYIIFNVPKGRALLQGNDAEGVLRYSEAALLGPASISVVMD